MLFFRYVTLFKKIALRLYVQMASKAIFLNGIIDL